MIIELYSYYQGYLFGEVLGQLNDKLFFGSLLRYNSEIYFWNYKPTSVIFMTEYSQLKWNLSEKVPLALEDKTWHHSFSLRQLCSEQFKCNCIFPKILGINWSINF